MRMAWADFHHCQDIQPRVFAKARLLEEHPMSTTINSALVADLTGQVSGSDLGPEDDGYEAARAVLNGLIQTYYPTVSRRSKRKQIWPRAWRTWLDLCRAT